MSVGNGGFNCYTTRPLGQTRSISPCPVNRRGSERARFESSWASTGAFADLKYAGMWKQALVPREDLLHVRTPLVHKAGPYISAFHLESSQRLSRKVCRTERAPISFSLFLLRSLTVLSLLLSRSSRSPARACAVGRRCRADVNKFPRGR